ncbi:hypothetical protein [Myxococcus landrumensis]|uniref:Uncharacterized protein n=1 Tax=Myxococcus landrumensis TaxID=2813577 RepID=A0ABX7N5M5_9BACT|nr:hypothetical protein [Myxococcus landrumus]QSQ14015.1 hypothetical protein JY572_37830 [Myxococcus landrumus]
MTPTQTLAAAKALLEYQQARPHLHSDMAATRRLIERAQAEVSNQQKVTP